jgi:hypothetical protein
MAKGMNIRTARTAMTMTMTIIIMAIPAAIAPIPRRRRWPRGMA